MPKWGLSMQEGLIGQWLKQEGDTVQAGEPIVEIETEKITNVVEAPAGGILAKIVYPKGATVPVTQLIAIITAPGEPIPEIIPSTAPAPAKEAAATPAVAATPVQAAAPAGGVVTAAPAARKMAKDHGLDLARIRGTGPRGMITKEDVEAVLAAQIAPYTQSLQKVAFYSDGHRLVGLMYNPSGMSVGEKRPGVVLCVGYTYVKTMVMPDIAKVLNAAGYVGLVFDYRGFGDSEGPRWRLMPDEQVRDIRAALTFLADQPHVDPAQLAVVGISLGGANALVAGALDSRVGAVVAIEAPGDCERWLRSLRPHWQWQDFQQKLAADRVTRVRSGHSSRVDPLEIVVPDPDSRAFLEMVYQEFPEVKCDLPLESADALLEHRPEMVVEQLSPRPVLFIHGDNDRLVSVDESRSLYAWAGEPRRLEIVPGMGHFDWVMPTMPGFSRVANLVVEFLQEVMPVND
jgi:hypothetical protein